MSGSREYQGVCLSVSLARLDGHSEPMEDETRRWVLAGAALARALEVPWSDSAGKSCSLVGMDS
jgi:hypothetical protein